MIPGATVKVTNLETNVGYSAVSTTDGVYLVPALPPARYRVSVSSPGFKTYVQEPVTIVTETVSTLEIKLSVGQVNQQVSVSAESVQLETTSSETGTVMSRNLILDLPIAIGGSATTGASGRRQIESFTFLTPGVTGTQWSKSINGAPGFSQEVLYDGIDAQNIGAPGFIAESSPPYESVQEFKVQNALYPAEYGAGYGVLNFTLKSGTNRLHGDAFEFLRNNVLDAGGFFYFKPPLQQNEYGGTLGGPVVLPHIYNGKDRTFFFASYSGFQLRGGLPTGGRVTLPTAQERAGDFRDFVDNNGNLIPIFDPTTTQPDGKGGFVRQQAQCNGVLNVICPGKISGVAQRLIPLIPNNEFPGIINNYSDHSYQPTHDNSWSGKVDHIINDKQRLSVSYWWTSADAVIYGPLGTGALDPNRRHTPTSGGGYRINHNYSISPTVLNHLGFGYTPSSPTWSVWLVDPRKGNAILQIPGIPQDTPAFPRINFDQIYQQFGNSPNQAYDPQYYQNWTAVEDLTWVKGRHELKFGFMYRHRKITAYDADSEAGAFNFDALSTSQPDSTNFTTWGNAFASFLFGQVLSANRNIPEPTNHMHETLWSWYGQDVIKVTPKLTMTFGLRYELPWYAQETKGIMSLFNPTLPNPGAGGIPGAMEYLGYGPGHAGTTNIFGTYHRAIAPRLSLAYALNQKTVARLGYGMFYFYPNYGRLGAGGCGLGWCQGYGALPSFASTDSGIHPAFLLDSGFPSTGFPVPDFDPSVANNGLAPYINSSAHKAANDQTWTVDLQRNLPFNIMLDTAYVGSHTVRLWTGWENINQVNPSYLSLGNTLLGTINTPADAAAAGVRYPYPGFSGSVAQALRPYPQYTTLYDMYQPTGFVDYNSLQVRLEKQFSKGLSFLGSYTLAKSIGVSGGDTFGDVFGGGGVMALNTFNRSIEKSIAGNDQTHTFIFSWSYELPVGKGKRFLANSNPVARQILGGWQVNSIETYHSGTPIGVGGGTNIPLFGAGNRPNWISSNVRTSVPMSSFDPAVDLYLNINAFSQPAPYTFGDGPPLLPNVRTPAYYNEDFSLFKKIYLPGEARYLEFRAEFFDVFNRVVFGGPAANINNPTTFGVISSQANTPRVIQFALKLVF